MDRRELLVGSRWGVALLFAVIAMGGCRAGADKPTKPAERTVAWHRLGTWSGRGNLQTESFTSDTGALRVRWETTPQAGDAAAVVDHPVLPLDGDGEECRPIR